MTPTLRRRTVTAALLAAAALALAPPALSQSLGAIEGTVSTADGEPLPGALIFLTGNAFPEMKNAVTREDGTFQFFNLPEGLYQLQTTMTGFAADETEVTVTLGETSEVTIALQPTPLDD